MAHDDLAPCSNHVIPYAYILYYFIFNAAVIICVWVPLLSEMTKIEMFNERGISTTWAISNI